MKIGELYEKYLDCTKDLESVASIKEKSYELFDKYVSVASASGSSKLALARIVNSGCIRKVGEYEYIDVGLQKITMTTALVSRMAGLELDERQEGQNEHSNYDKIYEMGIEHYLSEKYSQEYQEYRSFLECETETVYNRNTIAAIAAKYIDDNKEGPDKKHGE